MGYMSIGSLSKNWVINKRNNNSITFDVYCSGSVTRYLGNSTYLLELDIEIRNTSQTLVMSAFTHTLATTGYSYYGTRSVTIDINTVAYSFTNNQQLYVQVKNKNDVAEYTNQSTLYVRPVVLNFGAHATEISAEYDDTITLPVPSNPPAGWNLTYNWLYDGSTFGGSTSFDISNYASWFTNTYIINFAAEMNKITYNITMNYNGGIGGGINSSTYQINSSTQLRDLTPPGKADHTFQGWTITSSPTGGSISILSNTQLRIESNTYGNFTVSAVYSWNYENQQYAIGVTNNVNPISYALDEPSYDANSTAQQTINFYAVVDLGYNLYGFGITRTGTYGGAAPYVEYVEISSEEIYTYRIIIPAGSYGTFDIYPQSDFIYYPITYNLNGGTGDHGNPVSYTIGTPDFMLDQGNLVKTGYTFLGWFTAASGGSQVTAIFQGSTGDVVFYAQWEIINYNIAYTLNGSTAFPASGTPVINPTTYNILSALITFDAADFSRPGWTFNVFNPASIAAGSTGNKTIALSWSAITYSIAINNNGGSGMSLSSASYNSGNVNGSSITRTITPPTRAGYTVGSYTIIRSGTYGGSAPTVSGNTITIPSGSYGDFTVRANWTGNVNDYAFTSNSSTVSGNWITQGTSKVFNYSLNNKTGYTKNGGLVTIQTAGGNTTVSGTSTLTITVPANAYGQLEVTGQYAPNNYTIVWDVNGGSYLSDMIATYDVELGTLPVPVKAGYNFGGWFTNATLAVQITSTSKNLATTGTVVLYGLWIPRVLTINYAAGSGTGTMTPSTGSYAANVLVKANGFSRAGYTFNGWLNSDTLANATNPTANTEYLVNDLSSTIDDEGKTSETITLTAQWVINQYTVTFEENSGSNVNDITQDYNSSVSKPTNPTRTGYNFDNWYADAGLTTVQTWPFNMPVGGRTLYAKWNIRQFTIYFVVNGGSSVSNITQDYNSTVTKPADPTKLENNFAGWYTDPTFTNAYTFNKMPANDVTLYAKWLTNQYTLQFIDHNGTVLQTGDYDFGMDLSSISSPSNPIRTGYTFNGWSQSVPSTMPANNVTIIAQYTINQYTISFEENGGTAVADITQNYDSVVVQPTNPTRTGYAFSGWYSDAGLSIPYVFDKMPASNTTAYAKWTINQYTISFTANGGSATNSITQNFGTNVSAPSNPTRTGYTFDGWYQDALLQNAYTFTTMPASNITLYAKWIINQYTISFEENGGSEVNNITQNYDTNVSAPTNPTKEGHNFGGWYLDELFAQAYMFNKMPAQNLTLYAKWLVDAYTLQYVDWNGTVIQTGDYDFGHDLSTITPPANPVRTGYTFNGWNVILPSTMPANNITVTAVYTINQYTISFEENGGTGVNNITQNYGTNVSAPSISRVGYTFGGWFTEVGLTNQYTFTTMPASNITLYAKWTVNQYTITLVENGGVDLSDITQNYDTDIVYPVTTRPGYTFSGWFTDAGLSVPNTLTKIPAYNQTLYAKWTGITYTITVNLNGGTGESNKTFTTNPAQQTRNFKVGVDMTKTVIGKKHLFSHWEIVDNTSGTISVMSGATLTIPANAYGAITLNARWNVAIRKQRVGNTRLEENKLKVGSNSVSKVIVTNAAAEPEVIFEKDLYLEDL